MRSTEAIERAKLEAEYETRLRALAAEAERRERELGHQMAVMQQVGGWRASFRYLLCECVSRAVCEPSSVSAE